MKRFAKMNVSIVFLLVVLVLAVALMGGCSKKATEKPSSEKPSSNTTTSSNSALSAREAFSIALKESKKWSSDANLVNIDNFMGSTDMSGKADRWVIKFNSTGKNKGLAVHVGTGGKIIQTMQESLYSNRSPIKGNWIDSSKALSIAFKQYNEKVFKNYWLGLSSDGKTVSWYVKFRYNKEEPAWAEINALSGEVVRTWSGY